jgi:hypothetical protein
MPSAGHVTCQEYGPSVLAALLRMSSCASIKGSCTYLVLWAYIKGKPQTPLSLMTARRNTHRISFRSALRPLLLSSSPPPAKHRHAQAQAQLR